MAGVSLKEIQSAAERIRAIVPTTPMQRSNFLEKRTGSQTFLKLENLNLGGSFKIRGATNALLQLSEKDLSAGVIAASAGNHAQGVALTCRRLGVKCTIFMPERAPLVKAQASRELGATVKLTGHDLNDAVKVARDYVRDVGGVYIHPYENPAVVNGQGTVGLEILEQVPDVSTVFCSIGGGGILGGTACAIKALNPKVRIVGVQSEAYPSMKRSLEAGKVVAVPPSFTIADGIAVKTPCEMTLNLIREFVDDVVLVGEDAIASAVMGLVERDHMLAEGAGAASVAAMLQYPKDQVGAGACVCVVTGGNMDVNLLNRIIPNGLKYSGRLMRLTVCIKDRPGGLAELLRLISGAGGNMIEVVHNRLSGRIGYDDVEVNLDVETSDYEHQDRICSSLQSAGYRYNLET